MRQLSSLRAWFDQLSWRAAAVGNQIVVLLGLWLRRFASWLAPRALRGHPAQGLVEYGLILVLIMVVCVGILSMTGKTISDVWYNKIIKAWPK